MNYFRHDTAAARYARGRPYFHPLVVARIRAALRLTAPLPRALDVACGTGQSTVALEALAARVVGTDRSRAMLAAAPRHPRVAYVAAAAERQPFAGASFDLLTVALAFHWFQRAPFLAEVRRLLRPAGWLVIYDNAFLGRMLENRAFEPWCRESYAARYPSPPRDQRPFTDDDARAHGFRFTGRERFENTVTFSAEELARYLMTQSNVAAALEEGAEHPDDVRAWLARSVAPFFPAPRATFRFGTEVWYLRPLPLGATPGR